LTGYFDYRPKDADEALVAATSTDNGQDWTFDSEALEENNSYCPTADVNDDGEGHSNVITVGGNSMLYTLARAAGDMQGVGMIVHQLNPTPTNPLSGLPATESIGIDPDAFATGTAPTTYPVPVSGTAENIPVTSTGTAGSPEQLVTGAFIDWTQFNGNIQPADQIQCTVTLGTNQLTNCLAPYASGPITINPGDLLEQVLGYTSPSSDNAAGPIPTGPNTTNADAGQASETIESIPASGSTGFSNPLTGTTFNNNAPNRLYLDNTTIYCSQANANPTTHIENCTTPGPAVTPAAWSTPSQAQIFTGDPIIPATAYDPAAGDGITNGLVAPDGIVGALPNYPNVPSGDTAVMYTEKELSYYVSGESTNTIGTVATTKKAAVGWGSGTQTIQFIESPYISESLPSPSAVSASSPVTVSVGLTIDTGTGTTGIAPVTCTGLTEVASPGNSTLTGCTVPSSATYAGNSYDFQNYTMASNSYLGAPGATTVAPNTLALTGEGSASNAAKLYKNNEDLTVLRVAYTADGVNFSSAGLTNNGIVSDCVSSSGVPSTTNSCTSPGSSGGYTGINDPASNSNPPNGLNSYANNEGTPGGSNGTSVGSQSGGDLTEMRWAGSAGSIIVNPNGTYGLFLSGAWAADGDSDAYNQIFYSEGTTTSSDGVTSVTWSTPTPIISTDYSFSASYNQDNNVNGLGSDPIGMSAYYEGRAYGPSVVQNPNGTLTMVFAGYRFPKSISSAGTVLGTGSSQWTVGQNDATMYRNILTTTLSESTSPAVPTQTTMAPVTSPVVVGQPQTLSATVSPVSPGTGTPTGTVTFSDSAGTLCTASLNESSPDAASCSYTYSAPLSSPDSVNASYGGDNNYANSTSTSQSITVNQDGTTTSTPTATNGGNPANPAVVGEQITFTSTVAVTPPGTGPPTGAVTFADSNGALCSGTLSSSSPYTASCPYAYSSPQSGDSVTAAYGGDTINAPSISNVLIEAVNVAPTTSSSLTASPPNPVVGQSVTLSATVAVSSPGAATPSGTVSFSGNGAADCTGTLDGDTPDVASCTTSYPDATTGTVSATYGGDQNTAGSSGTTQIGVAQAATTTNVSVTPSDPQVGQAVTLSATVAAQSPGSGLPTGTVTFTDAGGTLCDAVLGQGSPDTASCTTAFNGAAADTIMGTYGGDTNYTGSSGTGNVMVAQGATTTVMVSSQNPSVNGQVVTFTATVAAHSPAKGVPTGTVAFGFTPSSVGCQGGDTVTLVNGTASCTVADLTSAGSVVGVTATYSGSSAFTGSSFDTMSQKISKDNVQVNVGASANPVVNDKAVTFSATAVAAAPGSGTPTGTFKWQVTNATGHTVTCTVSRSTDTCSVSSDKLLVTGGPYTAQATYSGNADFNAGVGTLSEAVSKSASKLTISVSVTHVAGDSTGVVTAHVTGVSVPATLHPTGTVTFDPTTSGGQTVQCTAGNTFALTNSGEVTCKLAKAPTASFPTMVTVTYSGDGNFTPASATKPL
jgi:hypothetical protein